MPDDGFRKWLGVEYTVMEDGHAVVHMNVRPEMQNLRNMCQGGIVASLIDVAMATAAVRTIAPHTMYKPPRAAHHCALRRVTTSPHHHNHHD